MNFMQPGRSRGGDPVKVQQDTVRDQKCAVEAKEEASHDSEDLAECVEKIQSGLEYVCEPRGIRHIAHGRSLLVGRSYNICTPVREENEDASEGRKVVSEIETKHDST